MPFVDKMLGTLPKNSYICARKKTITMKKHLLPLVLCVVLFAGCNKDDDDFGNYSYNRGNTVDHVGYRPECPKQVSNSNYIYITHTAKIGNANMRNYSMCFDKTKYAALWVAYPLHSCYMGSSSRSNAWGFDPDIDQSLQVNVGGYHTWNYTRGHQIPSADRTATEELNTQTFYMSNMTPQNYYFNGGDNYDGLWLNLETQVRKYVCSDTLYVVTGAHWGSGYDYVNKYPVPTHYYKVLLRTVKGNTGKAVTNAQRSDLKCIGFWLEHNSTTGNINKSYCKSVAEIERLTGHTFFPDVDVDKTACNPSDWGL